jgi:hypothetical protein
MIFGQCDCCGNNRLLRRTMASAMETYACGWCRHSDMLDDIDELQDEIKALTVCRQWLTTAGRDRLMNLEKALVDTIITETGAIIGEFTP